MEKIATKLTGSERLLDYRSGLKQILVTERTQKYLTLSMIRASTCSRGIGSRSVPEIDARSVDRC
jgi:hypothetical protein